MPSRVRSLVLPTLCAALALLACVATYDPGLSTGYFFDDAANLPVLGEYGRVDDAAKLARYITAGRADPTGRPIALLSFLLDANDWPADPYPFKRTNLLLHLLNGALLFALLNRLGALHGLRSDRSRWAALFGAAAWLLHPLLVSTVLYIVQREAMLPAFFVLAGLHLWLSGRQRVIAGKRLGPLYLVAAFGLCTLLATLSKPNGILLPLLALAIDATLPHAAAREANWRRYRRWRNTLAFPLALAVTAGVLWVLLKSIGHGPATARSFTLVQRVITEPAILVDYLKLLFLADTHYGSLFHDQYQAAADLLHPWYTLPACLACIAACAFAWRWRRRFPIPAVAVLFFFAGHLLESTSLALELYFEHRNYLPALLIFWPLGVWLAGRTRRTWAFGLAIALLGGETLLTSQTISLWDAPVAQARVWAAEAPGSARAQAYAAQQEAEAGDLASGTARIAQALKRFPEEPQIAFTAIDLECRRHGLTGATYAAAQEALRHTKRDPGALLSQWIDRKIGGKKCPGLGLERLEGLLDASASNPVVIALPGRMQDIAHLRGEIALARNDPEAALSWFNAALDLQASPGVALEQAASLGRSGHPVEGARHLDHYDTLQAPSPRPTEGMKWLHEAILARQGYWPNEMSALRHTLANDAAKRAEPPPHS
ncbi:tetratricopeptide repeat protein [Luteibacter sp. NPDC031894]|uniref:tetratricopeptide repeat protein n=1 Tax=Luteibacter sp. NPDC031894 TaxID=3390572 RepID=UPI003D021527